MVLHFKGVVEPGLPRDASPQGDTKQVEQPLLLLVGSALEPEFGTRNDDRLLADGLQPPQHDGKRPTGIVIFPVRLDPPIRMVIRRPDLQGDGLWSFDEAGWYRAGQYAGSARF